MSRKRVGALILAAGLSSRMNDFKPLLQIAGKTLIEHAIGLFKVCKIDEIVTVTGHRADELIPVIEEASSRWVKNHNYYDPMFSSIQLGVQEIKGSCDAFFLLPADIPLVRPTTIERLLAVHSDDMKSRIYYPQYRSKRGHPPLIDSRLIGPILDYHGRDGLRGLLHSLKTQAIDVVVNDPFILMDADTPEDFIHLEKEYLNLS